jgi:hypothetical protein
MKNKILLAAALCALLAAGSASAQNYGFDPHGSGLVWRMERVGRSIRDHEANGDMPPPAANRDVNELRDLKYEAQDILQRQGFLTQDQWYSLNRRVNIIARRASLTEREVGGWYD